MSDCDEEGVAIAQVNGLMGDEVRILIATADAVQARWADVETAIQTAFTGAVFNDGYCVDRPLAHTLAGLQGPDRARYRHVLGEDSDGGIVGAFFRIEAVRKPDELDADPGWFFARRPTSAMRHTRRDVADAVAVAAHDLLRRTGFTRVVTNMGTRAGAAFLGGRHGYVHEPLGGQENRWVKTL